MAKKWIAINLLLLVIAGLLGLELRASILQFKDENDLATIHPARASKPATISQKPGASKPPEKGQAPEDFSIIVQRNIFSDMRGSEEIVEAIRPPEPPQLAQKPILVGTILVDNQLKALIIDPTGTSPDRRRPEAKRIGDVYRGFTITSISADRIVLESGTRREIIPLHEGTKKPQAGRTPVAATRVIAFGGSAVSGGAISVVRWRIPDEGGTVVFEPDRQGGGRRRPAAGVSTRRGRHVRLCLPRPPDGADCLETPGGSQRQDPGAGGIADLRFRGRGRADRL